MMKNISMKINFDVKNKDELKEQKGQYIAQYNNKTLKNSINYNAYLYYNNHNYIIVDCDDKESYKFIQNILFDKFELDNKLKFYTRSISTYFGFSKYKHHFYFKSDSIELKNNKIGINGSKLDILVNQKIYENKEDFESLNVNDFPLMTNDIFNKILSFKKKEEKKEIEKVEKVETSDKTTELEYILDNLDESRFSNYQDWLYLYMIFINEDLNLNIFETYSKQSKKYNKENNKKILKHIKPKEGLTVGTLYFWLKEDNPEAFKKIMSKNNDFFDNKIMNNKDLATLYYNMNTDQYIYNNISGWYAYNKHNVLEHFKKDSPPSLLNDISTKLQGWLESLKSCISLSDEKAQEKFKVIKAAYKIVGSSSFIKGVIDYLKNLYFVKNLSDKIDSNKNVIAFDNMLYDLELGNFRTIKTTDYIIKTTGYNINLKRNDEIKEKINKLLWSIFENDNIINYWKLSTALSIFGKSFESLYVHTGRGR